MAGDWPILLTNVKQQSLTLKLPASILQWIDSVRGEMDPSAYIVRLLEERRQRHQSEAEERQRWLDQGRNQYTEEVCRQTLQINEEFPIHEG